MSRKQIVEVVVKIEPTYLMSFTIESKNIRDYEWAREYLAETLVSSEFWVKGHNRYGT